jgi:FtsZ-binding cell division protein ZapB
MSYFMKYVISDIDCNEIRSKNKDLLKKINELEKNNEKLKIENNDLKYKLDGIMSSQDEIYKKYTDLIIKISKCKC